MSELLFGKPVSIGKSKPKIIEKMIITDSLGKIENTVNIRLKEETTLYILHFCYVIYNEYIYDSEMLFFKKLNGYLITMGVKLEKEEEMLLSPWIKELEENFHRVKEHRGKDKVNEQIDIRNDKSRKFYENEVPSFVSKHMFSSSGNQIEAYHRRNFFGLEEKLWKIRPEELKKILLEKGLNDPWIEGIDIETIPTIAYNKDCIQINPRNIAFQKKMSEEKKRKEKEAVEIAVEIAKLTQLEVERKAIKEAEIQAICDECGW